MPAPLVLGKSFQEYQQEVQARSQKAYDLLLLCARPVLSHGTEIEASWHLAFASPAKVKAFRDAAMGILYLVNAPCLQCNLRSKLRQEALDRRTPWRRC